MKAAGILLRIAIIVGVVYLGGCQDRGKKPEEKAPPEEVGLLPGEVNDPMWPRPIIVSVQDTACSDSMKCPSRASDCVTKTFTVQKDTTYYLTTSYFNGDTTHASCRTCATVYQDTTVIMSDDTACPTGGPRVNFKRLVPGVTYTLSVCMQTCAGVMPKCSCGTYAVSDGIVSMRRVFD